MAVFSLSISLVGCNNNDIAKEAEPEVKEVEDVVEEIKEDEEDLEAEETEEDVEEDAEKGEDVEVATEDDEQLFKSLDIEIRESVLEIVRGEEYSISKEDGSEVSAKIEDGKLTVSESGHGKTILVIPTNYQLENARVSLKGGKVFSLSNLKVENLEVDIENGNVSLEDVDIEDLNAKVHQGSAILKGSLEDNAKLNTTDGNIVLKLSNNPDDYSVSVELNKGNVRVGDQNFHGMDKKEINTGKDKKIDIYCSQGHVEVDF